MLGSKETTADKVFSKSWSTHSPHSPVRLMLYAVDQLVLFHQHLQVTHSLKNLVWNFKSGNLSVTETAQDNNYISIQNISTVTACCGDTTLLSALLSTFEYIGKFTSERLVPDPRVSLLGCLLEVMDNCVQSPALWSECPQFDPWPKHQ